MTLYSKLEAIKQHVGFLERWLQEHGYVDYEIRAMAIRSASSAEVVERICPALIEYLSL